MFYNPEVDLASAINYSHKMLKTLASGFVCSNAAFNLFCFCHFLQKKIVFIVQENQLCQRKLKLRLTLNSAKLNSRKMTLIILNFWTFLNNFLSSTSVSRPKGKKLLEKSKVSNLINGILRLSNLSLFITVLCCMVFCATVILSETY
jgi:hypothetical protein